MSTSEPTPDPKSNKPESHVGDPIVGDPIPGGYEGPSQGPKSTPTSNDNESEDSILPDDASGYMGPYVDTKKIPAMTPRHPQTLRDI